MIRFQKYNRTPGPARAGDSDAVFAMAEEPGLASRFSAVQPDAAFSFASMSMSGYSLLNTTSDGLT